MCQLTKDADKLICLMYKEYLERRDRGISKSEAKYFGTTEELHSILDTQENVDDVDITIDELIKANFVSGKRYLHTKYNQLKFEDAGTVYMENRFPKGLNQVLEFVSKLFGILK